jgi:hypothetical protein
LRLEFARRASIPGLFAVPSFENGLLVPSIENGLLSNAPLLFLGRALRDPLFWPLFSPGVESEELLRSEFAADPFGVAWEPLFAGLLFGDAFLFPLLFFDPLFWDPLL